MNDQDICDLAEKYGWRCKCASIASTGSIYLDLYREAPNGEEEDGDGFLGCETLRIRVSNHMTAHYREDFDYSPGGHAIEKIEARLSRAPTEFHSDWAI